MAATLTASTSSPTGWAYEVSTTTGCVFVSYACCAATEYAPVETRCVPTERELRNAYWNRFLRPGRNAFAPRERRGYGLTARQMYPVRH